MNIEIHALTKLPKEIEVLIDRELSPHKKAAVFKRAKHYHTELILIKNGESIEGAAIVQMKAPLAEIVALVIVNQKQYAEIAKALIQTCEEQMRRGGAHVISHLFSPGHWDGAMREEILVKHLHWSAPKPFLIRLDFDCYSFHPKWYDRGCSLPVGFSLFPWKDIQENDLEIIAFLHRNEQFHTSVLPTRHPDALQTINSLGLRHHDQLIGWMVTHTFPEEPETIRYSSLFITRAYRGSGLAIQLLIKAIKLQQASPIRWSYCEVNEQLSHAPWLKFLKYRLSPYTTSVSRYMQSTRALLNNDLLNL